MWLSRDKVDYAEGTLSASMRLDGRANRTSSMMAWESRDPDLVQP